MKNLRVVNLVLLVLYIIYFICFINLVVFTLTRPENPWVGVIMLVGAPMYIYITIVVILTITNLFNRVSKPIINNRASRISPSGISILIFMFNCLHIFYSLFSNFWIIGILVIVMSIYKIYLEIQLSSFSAQNLDNSSFKNDSYMDNYIQENQEEKSTEDDFTQKIKNYYK